MEKRLTLSDARWPDERHFLAGGLGGSACVIIVDVAVKFLLLPAVTMRASGRTELAPSATGAARLLAAT